MIDHVCGFANLPGILLKYTGVFKSRSRKDASGADNGIRPMRTHTKHRAVLDGVIPLANGDE